MRVIARVRKPGYTPPGLQVRTHIDPHILTAECALEALDELQRNPEVESVEVAETLLPSSH